MNSITISKTPANCTLQGYVFEYSLSIINPFDGDVQELTAAFPSVPCATEWSDWLSGWFSAGYSLFSQPELIRVI